MSGLILHPMKEIKIIFEGEHMGFVSDLLEKVKATGYTVITNISGKGHHGFHEGHLMFNDTSSLVMLITVVPEDKVEPILSGLMPLFNRHSGNMFVSDVQVSRRERFSSSDQQEGASR